MSQKKKHSLVEVILSTATGFIVSMLIWQIVGPAFGYVVTLSDNFLITCIFTIASILRGYVFRRAFNYITVRAVP